MSTREIRATLRGATADKVIRGWNGPMVGGLYVISPAEGDTKNWPEPAAIEFCEMLQAAGVFPVYRDSEPNPYPV
jgi:hypothetical protein